MSFKYYRSKVFHLIVITSRTCCEQVWNEWTRTKNFCPAEYKFSVQSSKTFSFIHVLTWKNQPVQFVCPLFVVSLHIKSRLRLSRWAKFNSFEVSFGFKLKFTTICLIPLTLISGYRLKCTLRLLHSHLLLPVWTRHAKLRKGKPKIASNKWMFTIHFTESLCKHNNTAPNFQQWTVLPACTHRLRIQWQFSCSNQWGKKNRYWAIHRRKTLRFQHVFFMPVCLRLNLYTIRLETTFSLFQSTIFRKTRPNIRRLSWH